MSMMSRQSSGAIGEPVGLGCPGLGAPPVLSQQCAAVNSYRLPMVSANPLVQPPAFVSNRLPPQNAGVSACRLNIALAGGPAVTVTGMPPVPNGSGPAGRAAPGATVAVRPLPSGRAAALTTRWSAASRLACATRSRWAYAAGRNVTGTSSPPASARTDAGTGPCQYTR